MYALDYNDKHPPLKSLEVIYNNKFLKQMKQMTDKQKKEHKY